MSFKIKLIQRNNWFKSKNKTTNWFWILY